MNAPSSVPGYRKQASWPRVAQLLAAEWGAAGEAVKGTETRTCPWPARVASPGAGAWALITEVLGLQGDAAKAALTLEQRQKVMKKVPASLQHWASEWNKQQFPSLATGGVRPDETARPVLSVFIPSSVTWCSWIYLDVWFPCSLQRSWCQWARDFFLRNSTAGLDVNSSFLSGYNFKNDIWVTSEV